MEPWEDGMYIGEFMNQPLYVDDTVEWTDTDGNKHKHVVKWDSKKLCYCFDNKPIHVVADSGFFQNPSDYKRY